MTFRDDPSYYESCYRCGDDAIGMPGLCHFCHESAETVEQMHAWINVFINNQVEQGFDRHLFIEYGVNVIETSEEVQKNVKQQIELMTGLNVVDVNVFVQGVKLPGM